MAQAPLRPDRQRGRQLRRRRARPGADRRRARVHRADDPRRPVRGLARGDHLPARPRAARRRHARRDPRRDHHAVQRLPDGHGRLDRSGRSSTSRSRTTSSSRGSRPGRCRCTRSSCSRRCCSARRCSACSARWRSWPAAAIQISARVARLPAAHQIQPPLRRRVAGPEPGPALVTSATAEHAGEAGDAAADHEAPRWQRR